jgi:very-short-patch-repair endonuclease
MKLDKARNAYIKKVEGGSWTLLRFWETEITKDVKAVVDKIEKKLKEKTVI